MTNTTKPSGRIPSHEIFHVVGDAEKGRWTKIGVAWSHEDGDGLNLAINYQPLLEGRTVIRRVKSTGEKRS